MSQYQSGKNLYVAFKPETTFGTAPAVVTGATHFRANPSSGLGLKRALINPGEFRSDGMTAMARLGSKSVTGSYVGDLSCTTFDALMEAALRGTWATGTLINGAVPLPRSFTFEEYEQDIDISSLYKGCRVTSMKVMFPANGMATIEFGVVGQDMTSLAAGASPFYTSPTLSTTIGLTALDASITLGGVSALDFTSCEFTWDLKGAGENVIGSVLTPDVFTNNGLLTGSISALRKDASRQATYLAETEVALVLALAEPAPGTGTLTFTLPRIKFTDYTKALGQDNAMIATLPFVGAKDEASTLTMIEIQTA